VFFSGWAGVNIDWLNIYILLSNKYSLSFQYSAVTITTSFIVNGTNTIHDIYKRNLTNPSNLRHMFHAILFHMTANRSLGPIVLVSISLAACES